VSYHKSIEQVLEDEHTYLHNIDDWRMFVVDWKFHENLSRIMEHEFRSFSSTHFDWKISIRTKTLLFFRLHYYVEFRKMSSAADAPETKAFISII